MVHTPIAMEAPQQSDFSKYWLMLRRRWLPAGITFVSVLAFSLIRVYQEDPKYIASGRLKFEEGQRSSELIGLDSAVSENQSSIKWQRSIDTEILSMTAPEQLIKVIEQINDPALRPRLAQLQGSLKVIQLAETNVVQINYSSHHPQLSSVVINQIMKQYVGENLEKNRASTLAAIDFINKQLPEVKQRVFNADSALRRFKETNRVTDLDGSKSAVAKAQTNIQVAIDETERQLIEAKGQQARLQNLLGLAPQQALLAITNGYSSIVSSQDEVEKQLAEARSSLQPDHPAIQDLEERQAQLQTLLKDKVEQSTQSDNLSKPQYNLVSNQQDLRSQLIQLEIKRRGLSQQLLTLKNQLVRYSQQSQLLPKLEQQQRDLERNSKAASNTYQNLLEQLQELKVTANQAIPTVKILQEAAVPRPSRTTYTSAGMRGGMAGMFLAAGLVYLLERVDRKLKSKDDIRQVYPYRILGEIPTFNELEGEHAKLPTVASPSSHISESYRMLQASIKFLSLEFSPRIIMITSAITQEGKSTTCANLAVSLAQMNHRVLLIDADIRLASQHHIWELRNQEGLTHILLNKTGDNLKDLPIHQVVQGVDVITAGRVSSNPLPMLESEKFFNFVQSQLDSYDYILIDSPPLVSVADPLVIGKVVDGILLVARPEQLEREFAQKAKELLTHSNLTILGTIINGLVESNEPHSYYSYYGRYTEEPNQKKNGSVKQLSRILHSDHN